MTDNPENTQRFVETSTGLKEVPRLCGGGFLEEKNGEKCIRLADSLEAAKDGTYDHTREWLRPGQSPFSTDLYPMA